MRRITNLYSRVGTDPFHYLNNYMDKINHYEVGHKFKIIDKSFKIIDFDASNKQVFISTSNATFRQNIDAWKDFGFVYYDKQNNLLIKIVDKFANIEQAIELIKINLLREEEEDKYSNNRKNSILLRLIVFDKSCKNEPINFRIIRFKNKTNSFNISKIKEDIGKLENKLYLDKEYMKIINSLEFYNNDLEDENE